MKAFLTLIAVVAFVGVSEQAKLKLSVYYESRCPDSRRFIINQLYPLLTQLGGVQNDYVLPDFVPYGKANTTFANGNFSFVCQHGDNECLGNIQHSCALAKLAKNESAAFINCMMTSFDAPNDAESCANELGLNYTRVGECYNSWEGPTLKAANGIRTHELSPPLYYVPWITYDDVWTVEDMQNSETNLIQVICQKLGPNERPALCSQQPK